MRVWVLNLDAERELARTDVKPDVFAMVEQRPELPKMLGALVGNDRVLSRGDRLEAKSGTLGLCWCPTPFALAALARAGVKPPPAPDLSVLRRVNHRAFSSGLGHSLEGERFATTVTEALAHLERPSPSGVWVLKRPLGFAGRGRALAPPITDAVRKFVETCVAREGGVQIEPWLERLVDVSIHGYLDDRGDLITGAPTVQTMGPHGAWRSSRLAEALEITDVERETLNREAVRVAEALAKAGYFGPFGIDAFRYLLDGRMKFQSRCEINARYTMGWAIGMGPVHVTQEGDEVHRPPSF